MEKKLKAEILAVDDHCLVLEGICKIVNKMPEAVVVDAVTSGQQAAELIAKRNYDVYILDVSIPEISCFDLILKIRKVNENARIIVCTMHEEVWIINKLIRSKVNAVVLKSSEASELVNAVRCVLQGESYACPRFAAIAHKLHRTSDALTPKEVPTKRERDVLQAVAKGLNTHEIAKLLDISENTVETFRKRLISKFGAKNAIDVVVKAVMRGWITMN
ncbi:MAG: response regulator transcription factor [Bacteroides sp.]|nr:response regulator transcription factor [Bacteroides sp.]